MITQELNYEIAQLKSRIQFLEADNKRLENEVAQLEDDKEELQSELDSKEVPIGERCFTIDTGNDIIEIYMQNGNLIDKQKLESVSQWMSLPNALPELF